MPRVTVFCSFRISLQDKAVLSASCKPGERFADRSGGCIGLLKRGAGSAWRGERRPRPHTKDQGRCCGAQAESIAGDGECIRKCLFVKDRKAGFAFGSTNRGRQRKQGVFVRACAPRGEPVGPRRPAPTSQCAGCAASGWWPRAAGTARRAWSGWWREPPGAAAPSTRGERDALARERAQDPSGDGARLKIAAARL